MADIDVRIIPESTVTVELSSDITVPNTYTLPTASQDTLGGIKVGENLSITDGVLSASGGESFASLINEADIDDSDSVPFYDASATQAKKSLWSNIKAKLRTYFDTIYKGRAEFPKVANELGSVILNDSGNSVLNADCGVAGGHNCKASSWSFAFGNNAKANGLASFALGSDVYVNHAYSGAVGKNVRTGGGSQLICGENGTAIPADLFAVAWNGLVFEVRMDGTAVVGAQGDLDLSVATKKYVDDHTIPYTLPTASEDTLGGVKVGENLSITDGVLSVPIATEDNLGVVSPLSVTEDDDTRRFREVYVDENGWLYSLYAEPLVYYYDGSETTAISLEHLSEYYVTNVTSLELSYPSGNYECWLRLSFASSGTIAVTLPASTYIGTAPVFANGETWEISIKNGVVIAQRVGDGT